MIVTELIGGPLDGIEIELDEDTCTADLDSISIACWKEGDKYIVTPTIVRYRVTVWRFQRLALLFDGYEDE